MNVLIHKEKKNEHIFKNWNFKDHVLRSLPNKIRYKIKICLYYSENKEFTSKYILGRRE